MSASYTCSLPRLFYSSLCVKALKQRVVISVVISALIICKQLFRGKVVVLRSSIYMCFFFILEGMSKLAIFSTNGEQMMDG